jgi:hypothetical protein
VLKGRVTDDRDARLAEHLVEDRLRDVRLESPRGRRSVARADSLEHLGRHSAEERLLALDVASTQATAEHPADVSAGRDQGDRRRGPGRRDGRKNSAGGRPEDRDVRGVARRAGQPLLPVVAIPSTK